MNRQTVDFWHGLRKEYNVKRILMISNACFSNSISNGRTLVNLFENVEQDKIAQFFVYGTPDSELCNNYYHVSDRDALRSLICFKQCGGVVKRSEQGQNHTEGTAKKAGSKTPAKMLMREMVWLLGRWKGRKLWDWVDEFKPEMICLFPANNIFLIRLAIRIAKRYHIPVVVYSTEGYYFMDFNYLTNCPSLAYRIYYRWLHSAYQKLTPYVAEGFFNCTLLRDKYEQEFHYPCHCVMNGSKIEYINNAALNPHKPVTVSYLGNLGLKRHKALIEIAQTLQELNADYFLDVYGAAPNSGVEKELSNCRGIRYHGFVSYDEVVGIIHNSSLLVHAEWNDAILNRDLKYAFSTKIADSISSGTPFLMYAAESLAGTVFLKENECAFIANNKESLKQVLEQALNDEARRQHVVENAKKTSDKYFTGNDMFIQAFM